MIWPVVRYAPTAAKNPNIAAHPLIRSAISFSGSTFWSFENGFIEDEWLESRKKVGLRLFRRYVKNYNLYYYEVWPLVRYFRLYIKID